MQRHVQKALMSYQFVKDTTKRVEKKAIDATGIDRTTLGVLGAIQRIGSSQMIDTRLLKYKFEVGGVNTKPYLFYDYGGSRLEIGLNINFPF